MKSRKASETVNAITSTINSAELKSKNGRGINARKTRRTPILKAILPIDGSTIINSFFLKKYFLGLLPIYVL